MIFHSRRGPCQTVWGPFMVALIFTPICTPEVSSANLMKEALATPTAAADPAAWGENHPTLGELAQLGYAKNWALHPIELVDGLVQYVVICIHIYNQKNNV